MAFTDSQIRQLSGKLLERNVRIREEAGRRLSYIEGWHAIDEANRVFGFDAWDRETVWADCVFEDRREAKASYAARVRIRVRAGDALICRDGSGVGHGSGGTLGEAHESALKEAETDATKRALTTFGNLFGLALYDKEQNGVRRAPKRGAAVPLSWALLSGTGVLVCRHDTPESFCTALRQAIEHARDIQELNALWAANGQTLGQLRLVCPELRTAQGRHYADLLFKLHEQRVQQLKDEAWKKPPEAKPSIDKSVLPLSTPKRQRDPAHRQYVASLPCLVCGRMPSQAHHLRFAQLRSMGSKVSDEWTVPLCGIHHRALHAVGDEAKWWEEVGIDAKGMAEGLWRQSHGQNGAAASNGANDGAEDIPFLPPADDPPAAAKAS